MLKITYVSNRGGSPAASDRKEAAQTRNQSIPAASKLGLVVMAIGFLFDVVEHTLVIHATEATIGAFPVSEHAAHLVVIVGMVMVLVGIVIQGNQLTRRERRPNRSDLHAIR
jgi:hypothetical protein